MIRAYKKESASYDTVYFDLKCPYGRFSLHGKFVNYKASYFSKELFLKYYIAQTDCGVIINFYV